MNGIDGRAGDPADADHGDTGNARGGNALDADLIEDVAPEQRITTLFVSRE